MADNRERIEQFRKMAEADPGNEIGHFSLGRELFAAGDFAGSITSLGRVIEINPNISKGYQMLGSSLLATGDKAGAIAAWTAGVKVADGRGEIPPLNEMVKLIQDAGGTVPPLTERSTATPAAGAGQVLCKRCGRVAKQLARQPFRNAFGKMILENTCTDCWKEAIGQGTKVINELRLPLADPQAQKVWDQHISEFLHLTETAV
jgi:Fe-S cluster biosynthesis and repair protein YggX